LHAHNRFEEQMDWTDVLRKHFAFHWKLFTDSK
jgi:hypothetical protein